MQIEAGVTTKALEQRTCQIHQVDAATEAMYPTTVNLGLRNMKIVACGHGIVLQGFCTRHFTVQSQVAALVFWRAGDAN